MIRGVYCINGDEVRLKLFHQTHGSHALQGVWTAPDRWFIETAFEPKTLLLGTESDRETKSLLRSYMRNDISHTVVKNGLFRDEVREIIELDASMSKLTIGPNFGVFWTMAGGFGEGYIERHAPIIALNRSLSNFFHDEPILRDDGPMIVLYRNFFDNETCVRMRRNLWQKISFNFYNSFTIPFIEKNSVSFDGETYDLTSNVRIDRS